MKAMVEYLKALGDETRLRILQMLSGGEKCVCELVEALGMTQPAVSHHLKILKQAGIVQDRREGKWIFYAVEREQFLRYHRAFSELYVNSIENFTESDHSLNFEQCHKLDPPAKG